MTSNPIYVPEIQSAKTIEFIAKAKLKHGDRYDYSLVDYIDNKSKVKIICKIHGVFEQSPRKHLEGNRCKLCSIEQRRLTLISFIERANLKFNNKYDYNLTVIMGSNTPVIVTCIEHGDFYITPSYHLCGGECPECTTPKKRRPNYTTEQFVEFAKTTHGDRYGYEFSVYKSAKEEVLITCFVHGEFSQSPTCHISGAGCKLCANDKLSASKIYTVEEFIKSTLRVHALKYLYNHVDYRGSHKKVCIGCKVHGDFWQTPAAHLKGQGCPRCSGRISKIATKWLDSLNIESLIREYPIPEHEFYKPVDGYDPLTNTVYQFHGDYWHGNLNNKKYKFDGINQHNNKTFGELNRLTNESDDWIRSQGYNLVVMWELDFVRKNRDEI